jgi:hypothetical protein
MEIFSDFLHPYIFISGEGILAEGIKRIIVWEENRIILQSRERISIAGERLKLEHKGRDAVLVSGKVLSLEFSR